MIGNIPTDSFYKFCAILGTVVIIFNSYYSYEKQNEIENDVTQLLGEIQMTRYYVKKDKENNERSHKLLTRISKDKSEDITYWKSNLEAKNSGKLGKQDLDLLDDQLVELNHKTLRNERKFDSIQIKIDNDDREIAIGYIDINTQQAIIENKKRKIENYKFFLRIGSIIGVILFFYGFINWYKIQKIIDRNMKNGNL